MGGHEVADPDRTHFPVVVQLLERTVGAEGLVELAQEGLVQEQQVDLVDAELACALVERVQRLVVPVVADPDPRLDEDLIPGEPGLADRVAHAALVRIRGRGVDQPVPGRKSRGDGLFRLVGRVWKTPKPRAGITTPLFKVRFAVLMASTLGPPETDKQ